MIAAVAVLKLAFSAMAPASNDLQAITVFPIFNNSPWVILEGQVFNFWRWATSSSVADPSNWALTAPSKMSLDLNLLSLLLRLPAFVADVGVAFMLYLVTRRLTRSTELSRLSSIVWFLNPYNFLAAELLGVPDIVVALLVVITVFLLLYDRFVFASIILSFGIILKLYPILLVPPIILYVVHTTGFDWRKTIALIGFSVIGVGGYLSWIFPQSVAVLNADYTPVSQPMNLTLVSFSPGQGATISFTLAGLVLVYLLMWSKKLALTSGVALTLLSYYLFSNPYLQYFIWVTPFLTLDIILVKKKRAALFSLLMIFILAYWWMLSQGFPTPSRFSLLLLPLSQSLTAVMNSAVTQELLIPLLNAGVYAVVFVYILDMIRDAFMKRNIVIEGV